MNLRQRSWISGRKDCGCPKLGKSCSQSSQSPCTNINTSVLCPESCGEGCENQNLPRAFTSLVVKEAPGKGRGVFARTKITSGKFITHYEGETIPISKATKRAEASAYVLRLSDRALDAQDTGNVSRYFNHACEPTLETREIAKDNLNMLIFEANQTINAGDELTFNYGFEFKDCRCQSCWNPRVSAQDDILKTQKIGV